MQNTAMLETPFQLVSSYSPAGDQPTAIAGLVAGLNKNVTSQTLLGVTGSGKTFTMANVIAQVQRPTLVMAHNKTLAVQLYNEFKEFFPYNAVQFFISYYDYYQPEAYIPRTNTYIEKTASINDEIDRLRHAATKNLFERRDVIVVASVSCIYGLGLPDNYFKAAVHLEVGMIMDRDELCHHLVRNQYSRNDLELKRTSFRVRGDVLEIHPADEERVLRITFFDDEIEALVLLNAETGEVLDKPGAYMLYPAIHYVANRDDLDRAILEIENELTVRLAELNALGKQVEAQRLEQRTIRDMEMIREVGYCNGIENYSRIFEGRPPGTPPRTLIDYFADDFLLIVDESHVSLPQLRGMYHGDRSRKETLVDYGFRLPCAKDNRPLNFDEFESRIGQRIYVSATPAAWELQQSENVVEQVIRPTGLLDPEIEVLPTQHQVDRLLDEIRIRVEKEERVLITTLTKRMAEDLAEYFQSLNVKVRYLHSDIKPIERIEIIRDLRIGNFDVLIGVNLIREGLDLPEVSLVAIMDADKEGFLRSESSLIQTIGRVARNEAGKVLLFADKVTDSMQRAMDETARRRAKQTAFNTAHGIVPKTIRKSLENGLLDFLGHSTQTKEEKEKQAAEELAVFENIPQEQLSVLIEQMEVEMRHAAKMLDFEKAAGYRDQLFALKSLMT
jgi:excinuclease ABC subunit B